jgi:hypothetical protein
LRLSSPTIFAFSLRPLDFRVPMGRSGEMADAQDLKSLKHLNK